MAEIAKPAQECVLWLVRHGQTDWNLQGRYQGHADQPLNAVGLAEAARAAQELARPEVVKLDAVFCSDLLRAVQTAELIAAATGLTCFVDPRLREVKLGVWEGMLSTDIKQNFPDEIEARFRDPVAFRPPGGETLGEVAGRIFQAVDEITAQYPGGQVAVVSHGLALAVLIARAQGVEPGRAYELIPPNAVPQRVIWTLNGVQTKESQSAPPDRP
jgi:broad specificity phosphatase PhoE